MESIFASRSYKTLLLNRITSYPGGGRGVRKRLADFMGCRMSYLTQVFSGKSHLSLEQSEAAARFFQLNAKETEFFLLLVNYNRAGTPSLRSIYGNLLQAYQEDAGLLKNRLGIKADVKKEAQHVYYSSWHFAAVHMALLNEQLRTPARISRKLGIPALKAQSILEFLVEQGLATRTAKEFQPTTNTLHLRRDSPFLQKHHTNWRLKALQSIADEDQREAMHYSGVIHCSQSDLHRIREKISLCLEECISIVKNSPAEELAVIGIDLFSLRNRTTES